MRGEITRMRAEIQRAKAATIAARQKAITNPGTPVFTNTPGSMQVTGRVATGGTMVMGAWPMSSGRRMVAFATPDNAMGGGHISVRTQLIEAPDEVLNRIDLGTGSAQSAVPKGYVEALLKNKEIKRPGAPTVIMQEEEQAKLQVGTEASEPEMVAGVELDVRSRSPEDRQAMDLDLNVKVSTSAPPARWPAARADADATPGAAVAEGASRTGSSRAARRSRTFRGKNPPARGCRSACG